MKKFFAIAALIAAGVTAPLSAQILVYELEIDPVRSMNLDFYNEGYFVVPPDGGVGSFIFAFKKDGTRSYSIAPGAGRLYFARKDDNIHAVVEAGDSTSGTAGDNPDTGNEGDITTSTDISIVAFGEADQKIRFKTALSDNVLRVAKILRGGTVAWAEESFSGDRVPSHLGFAGVFDLKMDLEEKRTEEYNDRNLSVDQAIAELENLLVSRGYANENEQPDDGTDGGDPGDGGTNGGGGANGDGTNGEVTIETP